VAHRIAILDGDGIGPEVIAEALKVLDRLEGLHGFTTERSAYDLGGRRYLATGEVLNDDTLDELRGYDALFVGAIGTPAVPPGVLERGLLLGLRFAFDQYINLRPVKLYPGVASPIAGLTPDKCNFVVVRENTEGLYAGAGGVVYRGTPYEVATQESLNTRRGAERTLRYAFELATTRKNRLTLVHKTNVLSYAGDMWMRAFNEIGDADYPQVERDYAHVDAACLHFITQPHRFDVVVTDNLFGDIITDVAAGVQGGIGLAASANLDPTRTSPSLFEPIHGSAPDITGQQKADPVAAIMSLGQMLAFLGETAAADTIDRATARLLEQRNGRVPNGTDYTTGDVGDAYVQLIDSGV
jgi:3-isopropylmalate dehydrogenase